MIGGGTDEIPDCCFAVALGLLLYALPVSAQWTQQGSKLVGTGAVGEAQQGTSVSISSDGNTAVVGGYVDSSDVGAAWVFTRSGGVWTQQGSKLVGTGPMAYQYQGRSVSLSSDGSTAIVDGTGVNGNTGATWVWRRSSGIWTQQGSKLAGNDVSPLYPSQGLSVSLSSDGNTAIVGGPGDNHTEGAAWVFSFASTTIHYVLPQRSHVTLTVYSTLGQKVAELVNAEKEAGSYDVTFNAGRLASGVYLYRISVVPLARRYLVPTGDGQAGSFVETKKLILLRKVFVFPSLTFPASSLPRFPLSQLQVPIRPANDSCERKPNCGSRLRQAGLEKPSIALEHAGIKAFLCRGGRMC